MSTQHFLSQNLDVDRPVVAIFGSAAVDIEPYLIAIAEKVGEILSRLNVVVVTGGCTGVPSIVARSARVLGVKTMAFFPDEHEEIVHHNKQIHNNDNPDYYDMKYYFKGFSDRSLQMIKVADLAIIVNGRIGTLSEWAMSVEEGLPCIVLRSGGVTEIIGSAISIANREFTEKEHLIVDSIEELEKAITKIISFL